jgi:hypothetical protein
MDGIRRPGDNWRLSLTVYITNADLPLIFKWVLYYLLVITNSFINIYLRHLTVCSSQYVSASLAGHNHMGTVKGHQGLHLALYTHNTENLACLVCLPDMRLISKSELKCFLISLLCNTHDTLFIQRLYNFGIPSSTFYFYVPINKNKKVLIHFTFYSTARPKGVIQIT